MGAILMNCISAKNHEGVLVIFTEEQRRNKMQKHPELRDDAFIARVKYTIENPGFIYPDFAEPHRLVYYKHEYSVNGRPCYVKVVINVAVRPYFVITAFRPNRVKERGKTRCIYGEDNE